MLLLKHLPSHRFKTMQIIAHTPQGIFKTIEEPYDELIYEEYDRLLADIDKMHILSFETIDGQLYMTKGMINQSVFIVAK
jgi:hypothetical protein